MAPEGVGKKRPAMSLQGSSKRGRSMGEVLDGKQLALAVPTSREMALSKQRRKVEKQERKKVMRAFQREAEQKLERAIREEAESERISAWIEQVEECPVFKPTREQFKDPLQYIKSLERQMAGKYGICKIVPPYVNKVFSGREKFRDSRFTMEVRRQPLKMVDWEKKDNVAKGTEFNKERNVWTFKEFQQFANDFVQREYEGSSAQLQLRFIEREFWSEFLLRRTKHVRYASDVPGTAFDMFEELSKSEWNLGELPSLADSVLRNVTADIPGVTKPMLYVGMLFSMFAWHVEDQYLYSINYHHLGAPKTWYGVPGCAAQAFERVALEKVFSLPLDSTGESMAHTLRLLIGKTIMFPPGLLVEAGVPVCRAVQQPGEFVVTFPRSYHAGFSNGFNCGEAVNFAMADWFPYGVACARRYRLLKQVHVVAHDELLCKEARALHARLKGHSGELGELAVHTMVEFVRLLQWQDRQLRALRQRGVPAEPMQELEGTSMECALCLHKTYLAHVVCNCSKGAPICFNHPELLRACPCSPGTAVTPGRAVAYLAELPRLTSIASEFEAYPSISQGVAAAAQAEVCSPELADEWQLCGRREEPMGGLLAIASREGDIGAYEACAPVVEHEDAVCAKGLQPGTPSQHKSDQLAGGSWSNSREGSPNSARSLLATMPVPGPLESMPHAVEALGRAHSSSLQVGCDAEAPPLGGSEEGTARSHIRAALEKETVLGTVAAVRDLGSQRGRDTGAGESTEAAPIDERVADFVRGQATGEAAAQAVDKIPLTGRTDTPELPQPSHTEHKGALHAGPEGVARAPQQGGRAAGRVTIEELPRSTNAGADSGCALINDAVVPDGQADAEPAAPAEVAGGAANVPSNREEGARGQQDREAAGSSMHPADNAVRFTKSSDVERDQRQALNSDEREEGAFCQWTEAGITEPGATGMEPQRPTALRHILPRMMDYYEKGRAVDLVNPPLVASPWESGSTAPPLQAGAGGQGGAGTPSQEAHTWAVPGAEAATAGVGSSRTGVPLDTMATVPAPAWRRAMAGGPSNGCLGGHPPGASLPEPCHEAGQEVRGPGAVTAVEAARVSETAGTQDERGGKWEERASSEEPIGRRMRVKGAARTCRERAVTKRGLVLDWQAVYKGMQLQKRLSKSDSGALAGLKQTVPPMRGLRSRVAQGAAAVVQGVVGPEQRLEARKQAEGEAGQGGSEADRSEGRPVDEGRPRKRQATGTMIGQNEQRQPGERDANARLVVDDHLGEMFASSLERETASFDLNGPPSQAVSEM